MLNHGTRFMSARGISQIFISEHPYDTRDIARLSCTAVIIAFVCVYAGVIRRGLQM